MTATILCFQLAKARRTHARASALLLEYRALLARYRAAEARARV